MQDQYIPISDIDGEYRYCYHMAKDISDLRKSILGQGILMPLWIVRATKLFIVDGFRRFQIARELEISKVPVTIYDSDEFEHVFLAALSLNYSIDKLSTIERFKAIQMSGKFSSASMNDEIMEILDIQFISSRSKIINYLTEMPSWLQGYFHRINISLRNLDRLTKYPVVAYMNWFTIANFLNFKGGELLQLMETIHEICIRDHITADELWEELSMKQRIAEKMTPQQMTLAIKDLLFKSRYPRLSQINDNIKEKVNQIKKNHKGSLDIYWDRSLEDSNLKFLFELNEPSAIDNILSFLKNSKNQNIINEIFDQQYHFPSLKK